MNPDVAPEDFRAEDRRLEDLLAQIHDDDNEDLGADRPTAERATIEATMRLTARPT